MGLKDYATRIGNAVLGRSESFEDAAPQQGGILSALLVGLMMILMFGLFIVIGVSTMLAAPKLSWCYNTYLGATDGTKWGYAILNFFFGGLYIPYYAFFLNPLCDGKRNSAVVAVGGRRKNW
jgi:hypothetical protein